MVSRRQPKSINSMWVIKSRSGSTRKSLRKDTYHLGLKKPLQSHRSYHKYLPVYRLKEAKGNLIQGTFYETELQKVIEKSSHLFRFEIILKSRGKRRKKEVLVYWKGCRKSYDSWLPASQLVSMQQP